MDKQRFRGILAAAVIIGIAAWLGGCGEENTPATPSVTYKGSGTLDGGAWEDITLTFTGHTSPTTGDSFTLQVGKNPANKATGTIEVSNGRITFSPTSGRSFTVPFSSQGVDFNGISVTFDGENNAKTVNATVVEEKPKGTVTYKGSGTLEGASVAITLTFTGHTSPTAGDRFSLLMEQTQGMGVGVKTATGTIAVSGGTITFTPKYGSPFTATLSSSGEVVTFNNALITFGGDSSATPVNNISLTKYQPSGNGDDEPPESVDN